MSTFESGFQQRLSRLERTWSSCVDSQAGTFGFEPSSELQEFVFDRAFFMPKPSEPVELAEEQMASKSHEEVKAKPAAEGHHIGACKWAKYKLKNDDKPEADSNFEFPDGGWVCS